MFCLAPCRGKGVADGMNAYIGRQAIYNRDYVPAAYELLYRSGREENAASFANPDAATRTVLANAVQVFGVDKLTGGKPAYVNFTQELLMSNLMYMIPPGRIIVELPGNLKVDEALSYKLHEMKTLGYQLSLGDYTEVRGQLHLNSVIHLFDYIRLNVRTRNRLELRELIRKIRRRSQAEIIMERVETEADFDKVKDLDFSLWQGYFFEKPERLCKEVNLASSPYGLLFRASAQRENALSDPLRSCQDLILRQPVLTHLLLGSSPTPNLTEEQVASSIHHKLLRIGASGLKKWACLVLLKQLNVSNSDAEAVQAYLRGIFTEGLIGVGETRADPDLGLYVGLFSLLEQVTDIPLEELLEALKPGIEVENIFMNREMNEYAEYLLYAAYYERTRSPLRQTKVRLSIADWDLDSLFQFCQEEAERAYETMTPSDGTYRGNVLH